MDTDAALVAGLLLMALCVPSFLNGWTESTAPRFSIAVSILGLALCGYAVTQKPSGYAASDVPVAFVRVFSMIAN